MNTLHIVLYSGSDYMGHPMSHLLEKVFTDGQLQCKSATFLIRMLNFVSGGCYLISGVFVSPLKSTSVQ